MDLFKKHVDTVIILGGILSSVFWMNGKFAEIDKRFNDIEKDIVMIMKNIMPNELAKTENKEI